MKESLIFQEQKTARKTMSKKNRREQVLDPFLKKVNDTPSLYIPLTVRFSNNPNFVF